MPPPTINAREYGNKWHRNKRRRTREGGGELKAGDGERDSGGGALVFSLARSQSQLPFCFQKIQHKKGFSFQTMEGMMRRKLAHCALSVGEILYYPATELLYSSKGRKQFFCSSHVAFISDPICRFR